VREDSTGRRTYGSYRAEVFASALTVVLMVAAAAYVVVEALQRYGDQVTVAATPMLVVGGLGLVVNVVALVLLRGGASQSLGVKAAYLEVVADTLGSVGVVVAGLLVARTGEPGWDTGVALAIGSFVAVRALLLGREVLAVLAQHAPTGMDPAEVAHSLLAVPGVRDVHDLHLWTLTSGMNVATAHLVAAEAADTAVVLSEARQVMLSRFGVEHATLQVEVDATGCHELSW
jgi:cobalt-zinc-cadmium efflux system protein